MALTENPFFKSIIEQASKPAPAMPQGQPAATANPQHGLPQVALPPQGHPAMGAMQGQPPAANGAMTSAPAPAPPPSTMQRPPASAYSARPGEPNRGMDPIDSRKDNQQTYAPYSPYGYNPMPMYDNGGDVKVENPGILSKLGSKAKGAVSALKSLPPNNSEAESLAEKQAQIDALAAQRAPVERQEGMRQIMPSDHVNDPNTEYGARPGSGQVLYHVDADGNLTPIKVAPPAPVQEARPVMRQMAPVQAEPRMKPIVPESLKTPLPTYDNGGDVAVEAARKAQAEGDARINGLLASSSPTMQAPAQEKMGDNPFGLKTYGEEKAKREQAKIDRLSTDRGDNVMQPSYMPTIGGAEAEQAPAMPTLGLKAAPIADSGGDVPIDVNDGKHQVAILQDGEKVLTPEQADKYRAEHPEESGAPADFQGRVLSNPKGIKPSNSEEDNRASDTDRLSGGAKASIDNAPLETPKGDISNPPAADVSPDQAREISAKTGLKPYSQVVEERSKEKANEQAGGVQAEPKVAPKEERGTPEERTAIEADKKNAMGKGVNGFVQLGTALINENALSVPKEFKGPQVPTPEQGAIPAGGASQPGLKPIGATAGPAAPALSGKEAFKQKIAQYDKNYQAAMDKAAQTNDPQYREQAARIKEAKLAYQGAHPWGSPESAHPGVLGKLGHIGEMVASRTPFAGISQIAATIPGSEGYRAQEKTAAEAETKEATGESTAENAAQAKADKTAADKYTLKEVTDTRPDSPTKGQTVYAGVNNTDPTDVRYTPLQAAPKATSGADKSAFQATLKKVGTADVSDPAQQKQALETAHNSKVITDDEYKGAMAYLGSTANAPATQVAAGAEKRTAGKTLYFDTPSGRKALTAAEARAQGFDPNEGVVENEGQVAKDREKNSTYRVIEKALTQYQKHIAESQITPADITAMTTITEESDKPDYISKLIAGVFDDLMGHPITGYSEKLMKGSLTKNQYQDLSPAGRQLIADYYTTMMAHFANMKAAQGTIPRNPFIIQTEMHTIPKPFLSEEEAKPAFQNYLDQVGMRNSDNVDFGGATGTNKAPAAQAAAPVLSEHQKFVQSISLPDGSHPKDAAKGPNGSTIIWSGKPGEGWVDLVSGKPVK